MLRDGSCGVAGGIGNWFHLRREEGMPLWALARVDDGAVHNRAQGEGQVCTKRGGSF